MVKQVLVFAAISIALSVGVTSESAASGPASKGYCEKEIKGKVRVLKRIKKKKVCEKKGGSWILKKSKETPPADEGDDSM